LKFIGKKNELHASADELLARFGDRDQISDWAVQAIAQAVELGIMNGTNDHNLEPTQPGSRAEVAAMIRRLLKFMP